MATLTSTNSPTVNVTVPAAGWWLKDPADPTAQILIKPTGDPKFTRTEQMGVHYPLGRTRPVITTDVVTGDDGTLELLTIGSTEQAALRSLMQRQATLLLQSPFGSQYYIRVMDGRGSTIDKTSGPQQYRTTVLNFVEVDMPAVP